MRYTLEQIKTISFNSFDFNFPTETMDLISTIAQQVGSPSYIKTPIFQKRIVADDVNTFSSVSFKSNMNKKRGNNRTDMISNNEWEGIKTVQNSKIEPKNNFDNQIDLLRLNLNKLTDKTFIIMREKIMSILNDLLNVDEPLCEKDNKKLGFTIYDILSNNKFYSKIYSELFTELIGVYPYLKEIVDKSFANYLEQFSHLEFVDPNQDYDKFCEINKNNEKRKSVTHFFVNLSYNGVIPINSIGLLLRNLLQLVSNFIEIEDKKSEVDEITEHVAILFTREMLNSLTNIPNYDSNNYTINGISFKDMVTKLSKSKSKDYKSLSNKTIFKYMDLIEM